MKRVYAETCDCEPGKALGDGVYRVMPIYLNDESEATRLWVEYRKTWEPAFVWNWTSARKDSILRGAFPWEAPADGTRIT